MCNEADQVWVGELLGKLGTEGLPTLSLSLDKLWSRVPLLGAGRGNGGLSALQSAGSHAMIVGRRVTEQRSARSHGRHVFTRLSQTCHMIG